MKFSIITAEFNATETIGNTLEPNHLAAGRAFQINRCRQRVEGQYDAEMPIVVSFCAPPSD